MRVSSITGIVYKTMTGKGGGVVATGIQGGSLGERMEYHQAPDYRLASVDEQR